MCLDVDVIKTQYFSKAVNFSSLYNKWSEVNTYFLMKLFNKVNYGVVSKMIPKFKGTGNLIKSILFLRCETDTKRLIYLNFSENLLQKYMLKRDRCCHNRRAKVNIYNFCTHIFIIHFVFIFVLYVCFVAFSYFYKILIETLCNINFCIICRQFCRLVYL